MAAAEPALEASLPVGKVIPVRRQRLSAVIAAVPVILAVLIIACGGDDEPATTPSPASRTPSSTRATTATATPGIGKPEFEPARAMELVQALSVDIGVRAAGTDGEKRAANYIRDELTGYGYQASLQPFPIETFVDVSTSLEVLSPQQRGIAAAALGGSTSASAEGKLVAAGLGFAQEFPSGTQGSIAVIERGEITFTEKVANATAAGASGVIIYNNQSGPFSGQLREASEIPAAGITREDGLALLDLLNNGAATGRLDVQTRTDTAESQNVVAKPPAGQCRLVIGGHYDSVPAGPGANDNASGTAVVIEMARAMAADGAFDDACFVLFGSEEIGLVGSAHYVASLPAAEIGAIEAMLNFDMLSVGDGWPLVGSSEAVAIAAQEAERLSIAHSTSNETPGGGSDHASFIDAGIPSVLFNCFCDPNYHTAGDRIEFVQERRVAEAGAIGLATAKVILAD